MKKLVVLADGSSIHTVKWIEGLLSSRLWSICLISMNPDAFHPELAKFRESVVFHQIPPRNISEHGGNYQYLLRVPKIRKTIRSFGPDIVSTVYLSSYGVIGALTRGRAKLAHFVVGNDVMIFPKVSWLHRSVTKFALSRADYVVSASDTMTQTLLGLGFSGSRILTQQYGVSDEVLNWPECARDFDFVSNRAWVENSNIPYLLGVLSAFKDKSVALIGHETLGSEKIASQIQEQLRANPSIEFLGSLPYQKNIGIVASSRFIVSLTTSDGASLSVLEGMALGCLPILSDTKPNREWVQHGENGVLVPLNDMAMARARIEEILAWPESKKQRAIEQTEIWSEIVRASREIWLR